MVWSFQQFRPYVLMMNTRAKASILLGDGKFASVPLDLHARSSERDSRRNDDVSAIPRSNGVRICALDEIDSAHRFPNIAVIRFAKRFSVITEELTGPAGTFASYTITPRGIDPRRTVLLLHGGGFVAGIDPFHVRYAARLAKPV